MSEGRRMDKKAQRRAERRRSHLNDPVPKQWNLRNIWVWGKHLPIDWGVILCTIFLTLAGSLMVLSASSYEMGITGEGNAMSEFVTQLAGIALGGVAFFVAMNLDYRVLNNRKLVIGLIAVTLAMMAIVFFLPKISILNNLHFGIWVPYINYAHRWIRFGINAASISIQPSEVLKLTTIIYLAYYITHNEKTMHLFWRNNFAPLAVIGVNCGFLALQPNLSTTCLVVFVTFIMLKVGGMRKRTLFSLFALGAVALFALAYITPDRMNRIISFRDPWADADDTGYQLVQSYYALGNGGWFGTGVGLSKQKHLFLPYAYSDFIFAIVGEEFGWLGGCLILLLFLLLIWFGYRIAIRAIDKFGCYLALGLTSIIAIQVILNLFVVTGMMPTTGIPLPFFTAGGTTMTIFLGTMGLLVSVSRRHAPGKENVAPPIVRKVAGKFRDDDRENR